MKNYFEVFHQPDLHSFDTLAFAGGGNRCWWQGGLIAHLLERGWALPQQLVGTSAGAAVAAACMSAGPRAAFQACRELYDGNDRLFNWRGLARLKLQFALQHIYPAWLESFVSSEHFEAIKRSGRQLRVAVTQPARALGLSGSLLAGSLAYLLDKKLAHSIHPRLPKWLGLKQAFFDLHQCADASQARTLLQAAAAAAPFMHSQRVKGQWAFDGGYTDNAPIPPQTEREKSKTLVLLTRHYPALPATFAWRGRNYWQPSRPVPVSTWDCRPTTQVRDALELGLTDARKLFG